MNDGDVNPDSKELPIRREVLRVQVLWGSRWRSAVNTRTGFGGGRWDWGPTGGLQGEESGYAQGD